MPKGKIISMYTGTGMQNTDRPIVHGEVFVLQGGSFTDVTGQVFTVNPDEILYYEYEVPDTTDPAALATTATDDGMPDSVDLNFMPLSLALDPTYPIEDPVNQVVMGQPNLTV